MSDETRKGRCLCGAVTFEARGAPRFVSNCHCESCRRAASAPSVTSAGFRTDQVTIGGATRTAYASSPGVTRSFCRRCGSPVALQGEKWADETHIPVCAFEAPEHLAPEDDHFPMSGCPGRRRWPARDLPTDFAARRGPC